MLTSLLQILYAKDTDQRSTTFEKSFTMGHEYQRRTKALILRAAVLKNQINVKVGISVRALDQGNVQNVNIYSL